MPDYVRTKITFKSPEAKKKFFRLLGTKPKPDEFDFEWIEPMPKTIAECLEKYNSSYILTSENKNKIQPLKNREWFNWYDWCVDIWGTKWDAVDVKNSPDSNFILFSTAWKEPSPLIYRLGLMGNGKLISEIIYANENASYAGYFDIINGEFHDYNDDAEIYTAYDSCFDTISLFDPVIGVWYDAEGDYGFHSNGKFHHFPVEGFDLDSKMFDIIAMNYKETYGDEFVSWFLVTYGADIPEDLAHRMIAP